ncbi:undecaprenyl-diphosphate phosphatase [Olsenella sp. HMSC062G07]|uniref:undecaprenyl-diphosphate phosphatase n=1 Tax=Olsenella sp. HMSC062G07 TaxID=1739330 RepID=UPI0008A2D667|nr:undecaprenyl-diphosphate phosphatase [Olsenella sp. HMSC062G07]OFK23724.1 undecaprenyl-diphosphatase [Olsenella sp. HMSC062G07]
MLLELIKAAIYGVVEGVTEWLPISSTGHMLLLDQFVSLGVSQDFWDMFLVVIQLGAILAVVVLFFHDLNPLAGDKSKKERRFTWSLWAKIVVACLPAAVIGIPLDNWMERHLGSPFVIAAALIVYGVAFIVIEGRRAREAKLPVGPAPAHLAAPADVVGARASHATSAGQLADARARVRSLQELGWGTAIGIGLFQVLSIVPGTSRSGSTIIGGLILGCSRAVAAEFTFFLAVPVMVGASGLRLVKYVLKGNGFAPDETLILLVGCLVAFLVSLAAIRFLMGFVKRHDFRPFGWYRIALGVAVIGYFLMA